MKKILYLIREAWEMAYRHRLYVLLPIFAALILLSLLILGTSHSLLISFIYAGL